MTNKARYRSYQVQMAALTEENRTMRLPADQLARRQKDIWDSCFDDDATSGVIHHVS